MDPYHYQTMHGPLAFPIIHPAAGHSDSRVSGGERRRPGAKLSTDPQSVAARERRHRISGRFRVLGSLVPGGSKTDTVSMLEQAIHYVRFLKAQVTLHQAALMQHEEGSGGHEFAAANSSADELMPASNGRGSSDEVMQLLHKLPVQKAASYAPIYMATHHPQLQLLDPWQMTSGSNVLPPLPPCVFVEEPATACYSEEVDLLGSY
jgi:hypothetical protein